MEGPEKEASKTENVITGKQLTKKFAKIQVMHLKYLTNYQFSKTI